MGINILHALLESKLVTKELVVIVFTISILLILNIFALPRVLINSLINLNCELKIFNLKYIN